MNCIRKAWFCLVAIMFIQEYHYLERKNGKMATGDGCKTWGLDYQDGHYSTIVLQEKGVGEMPSPHIHCPQCNKHELLASAADTQI